jgi:hypothetical protein
VEATASETEGADAPEMNREGSGDATMDEGEE